ncbi:guanylate kinase [Nitratiruptor tergarcus]|uniref:Guanylate kinase n=1 Tax=Nitratiruptor tergarcus DSM 16512 TaxID=1069081 RepID=A0A1W1WRF4_9BACT|nr:guanylate kinase [Nitratiruptor tergarcus]SMC08303.1 guanylate kinase [Nitratiruptor tergarcus DSM 16512]
MIFHKGTLLVLSGPSGSGKSTLIHTILQHIDNVYFSISTTTRAKREGEVDGRDYYFVSREQFEKEIAAGEFLEWANVHGNYYGTSIKPVKKAVEAGKLVLFDIDVQGFMSIKKSPFAKILTSVFITTPTMSELERRLIARGSDTEETIKKRLANAQKEITYMPHYDYILINSDLQQSQEQILAIAKAARLKRAEDEIGEFINYWKEH